MQTAHCARMHNKTGYAEFGYSHCYLKMDAPRALVFRPLVKGNEALGTRLVGAGKSLNGREKNSGEEKSSTLLLDFSSPEFFSRPFRLFPTPTTCPWVSEDDVCRIFSRSEDGYFRWRFPEAFWTYRLLKQRAAQVLSMNHTNNTIRHQIISVYMLYGILYKISIEVVKSENSQ